MTLKTFSRFSLIALITLSVFSCKSADPKLTSKRYKSLLEQNKQLKAELDLLKNNPQAKDINDEANRLNSAVRFALPGFESDDIVTEVRNGRVYVVVSDKLLFRSGSATIEDKGKSAVKRIAEVLKNHPDIEIHVEGHTDNIPIRGGQFKDNWELSAARAISITKVLIEGQVPANRITASGKAEFTPVTPNSTPEGRAKNRRTEIILIPNQNINTLNN